MIFRSSIFVLFLMTILGLVACGSEGSSASSEALPGGSKIASVPEVSATLDSCAPENISSEIEQVHSLMREFDDASLLASNTPLGQMSASITDLQRIRRATQDQRVPACLVSLKQIQLAHMTTVINTMLGFLSGADAEALNQSIGLARQQHDQYTLEMAGLLGLTVVPASTQVGPQETPEPVAESPSSEIFVTNPGPSSINIRAQPNLSADTLGILDINASAIVRGRTNDGFWYQIDFPGGAGQTAWVYVSLVQISNPIADLPVINPTP